MWDVCQHWRLELTVSLSWRTDLTSLILCSHHWWPCAVFRSTMEQWCTRAGISRLSRTTTDTIRRGNLSTARHKLYDQLKLSTAWKECMSSLLQTTCFLNEVNCLNNIFISLSGKSKVADNVLHCQREICDIQIMYCFQMMECDIIGELLNRNIKEVALQIFLHLDFQSLHASRQVNSQWNQFIKEWMFERKKGQEHLKVLTK